MWLTVDELFQDWIGDDIPTTDEATLTRWIGRAERLIRREFPTIQTRIDAGGEPDLADTVKDVVSAMVTRVLRNPAGHRQIAETTGMFTGSVTFAGNNPGGLYLEPSERDALREPGTAGTGKAYSVTMSGLQRVVHTGVCSLLLGGRSCSCGATLAGYPLFEGGANA